MTSLLMSLKIGPMRRITIVGKALQGKEIGIEDVILIDAGIMTMTEIMIEIMKESVDVAEIETGTGKRRGTETDIVSGMTKIMFVRERVGSGRGKIEIMIVGDEGTTQGVEVGVGIARNMMETTERGVLVAA